MEKREVLLATTEAGKFLSVQVYYHLGGMNFFTGNSERRGYYLSVTPVEIADGWRKTTAFSGTKALVLEVKRQSPKGLAQAVAIAETKELELIAHVTGKNKITLKSFEAVKA